MKAWNCPGWRRGGEWVPALDMENGWLLVCHLLWLMCPAIMWPHSLTQRVCVCVSEYCYLDSLPLCLSASLLWCIWWTNKRRMTDSNSLSMHHFDTFQQRKFVSFPFHSINFWFLSRNAMGRGGRSAFSERDSTFFWVRFKPPNFLGYLLHGNTEEIQIKSVYWKYVTNCCDPLTSRKTGQR